MVAWLKPAAAAESSACEIGNAVGLTSIEDSFSSFWLQWLTDALYATVDVRCKRRLACWKSFIGVDRHR